VLLLCCSAGADLRGKAPSESQSQKRHRWRIGIEFDLDLDLDLDLEFLASLFFAFSRQIWLPHHPSA